MVSKSKDFEFKFKYSGPLDFESVYKTITGVLAKHEIKPKEDSFKKEFKDSGYKFEIKISGNKEDHPSTLYSYEITLKGEDIANNSGSFELEGTMSVEYNSGNNDSLFKFLNKIDEKLIYKEKEKYLESIYKEILSELKKNLDEDYL